MKERSKETYKGITKNVIIKTARDTMILNIIEIILVICLFTAIGIMDKIIFWKLIVPIIVGYDLFIIYFLATTHTDREKNKINRKIANSIFTKDNCIKIFPKEGHFRNCRKFFEQELPQIADYFAILHENEKIEIVARFSNCDKCLHVEDIGLEKFITAYEIVETTK